MTVETKLKKITDNEQLGKLAQYLPSGLPRISNAQTDIPNIAKNESLVRLIHESVQRIPTNHDLYVGDARSVSALKPESVHLVLTSPPYWTLKEYRELKGQLGHLSNYETFLSELDKVWEHCFRALVPGARLICVVGDVCLSRRKNDGLIGVEDHKRWFQQIWNGLTGASTKNHPAPFPLDLADRLIRMFSFVGDTVLDPFMGTGTTTVAAAKAGRNSIGVEIDPHYFDYAEKRIRNETSSLFADATIEKHHLANT